MATFAEELYAEVTPLAWADEENDFALQKFCQALGYPFEMVQTLVRDTDDGKVGWSILLDPDRVPEEFLPWLRQVAGVPPIQGEAATETRERIKSGEGFRRGTPGAVIARAALLGLTSFILQERHDSPWNVRFLLLNVEYTPEIVAELAAMIPAGITVEYAFWTGMTYQVAFDTFPTYQDMLDGTATYEDLSG
jgi:hypothetical protein